MQKQCSAGNDDDDDDDDYDVIVNFSIMVVGFFSLLRRLVPFCYVDKP